MASSAPQGYRGPGNPQSSQAEHSRHPNVPDSFIQVSFKRDVAKAREILTELLKKATVLLQENAKHPGNQKDAQRLRFEKGLEDVFSVLDQIETNLKLAIQWHSQSLDSRKQVGLPIASRKTDEAQIPPQKCIQLQEYMTVVKVQIQAAKDLHDLITDMENRLPRSSSVQSNAGPPTISTPSGNRPLTHQ
ncbi:mediator of RNA polymerase II transcription subunit 29-like [Watersipora subatra]|uniref:mediator of RNA polymerase II transcription subunit 29-like n=1 Tax=Watersipora subatra TaxID=2589382 RepID=UPI00355B8E32